MGMPTYFLLIPGCCLLSFILAIIGLLIYLAKKGKSIPFYILLSIILIFIVYLILFS